MIGNLNNNRGLDKMIDELVGQKYDSGQEEEPIHENEEERKKRKIVVYKYSTNGLGLHESVIVGRMPFFLFYDKDNDIKITDRIEEENRVIIPPNYEEYPYEPYEFAGSEELSAYFNRAKTETIDTLYQQAKSIVSKYNDQDESIITLLAADIMLSYFQDKSPTIH